MTDVHGGFSCEPRVMIVWIRVGRDSFWAVIMNIRIVILYKNLILTANYLLVIIFF